MVKTTGLAAGRPSASKAKLSIANMADDVALSRINAQVTFDEHQKLKLYCAKNRTSATALIRKMIADLPD